MQNEGSEAGRVRRYVNADASPRWKRRKSSRAKHGATSQPKLHGKVRRSVTPIAAPVVDTPAPPPAAGPAVEVSVAVSIAGPERDPATVVAVDFSAPRDADPSDDLDEAFEFRTSAIAVPVAATESDPFRPAESAALLNPAQMRPQSSRSRLPIGRWATAASIVAACLLALGRVSHTDVSAHAVPEPVHSVRHVSPAAAELGVALIPLQIAAPTSAPASIALLPPPDAAAALPVHDLAATIAPSASERVLGRAPLPPHAHLPPRSRRIAKPRQPASKAIATETAEIQPNPAPPPADETHVKLAGRAPAPGRYEMQWGTARLHEDPNSENPLGPIWDFLAGTR